MLRYILFAAAFLVTYFAETLFPFLIPKVIHEMLKQYRKVLKFLAPSLASVRR